MQYNREKTQLELNLISAEFTLRHAYNYLFEQFCEIGAVPSRSEHDALRLLRTFIWQAEQARCKEITRRMCEIRGNDNV